MKHTRLGYNSQLGRWFVKDSRSNINSLYEHKWKNIKLVGNDIVASNNVRIDYDIPVVPDTPKTPRVKPPPTVPQFVDLVVKDQSSNIIWIGGSRDTPWVSRTIDYDPIIIYPDYTGGVKKFPFAGVTPCFRISKYYDEADPLVMTEVAASGTDETWIHIGYQSFTGGDSPSIDNPTFGQYDNCSATNSPTIISSNGEVTVLQATAFEAPNTLQNAPPVEAGQPDLTMTPADYLSVASSIGAASAGVSPISITVDFIPLGTSYYSTGLTSNTSTLDSDYISFTGATVCSGPAGNYTTTVEGFNNAELSGTGFDTIGESASSSYTVGAASGGQMCTVDQNGTQTCTTLSGVSFKNLVITWTRRTVFLFDLDPTALVSFTIITDFDEIQADHHQDDFGSYGRLYDGSTYGYGGGGGVNPPPPSNPFPPNEFIKWFAGDSVTISRATSYRGGNLSSSGFPPASPTSYSTDNGFPSINGSDLVGLPRFGTRIGGLNQADPPPIAGQIYSLALTSVDLSLYNNSQVLIVHNNSAVLGTVIGTQIVVNDTQTFKSKPARDFNPGVYSYPVGFWEYINGASEKRQYSQFYPDRGYMVVPCDYFDSAGKRVIRALVLKTGYDDLQLFDYGVSYIAEKDDIIGDQASGFIIGGTIRGEEIR